MLKAYQSIYVTIYRWNFNNFGQGSLPKVKSLFSVSFLLIILLTDLLVLTELLIKKHLFNPDLNSGMLILLGAVFFLMINHLIFLNNKWFKRINSKLAKISRQKHNFMSLVILLNVVIACFALLFLMG